MSRSPEPPVGPPPRPLEMEFADLAAIVERTLAGQLSAADHAALKAAVATLAAYFSPPNCKPRGPPSTASAACSSAPRPRRRA